MGEEDRRKYELAAQAGTSTAAARAGGAAATGRAWRAPHGQHHQQQQQGLVFEVGDGDDTSVDEGGDLMELDGGEQGLAPAPVGGGNRGGGGGGGAGNGRSPLGRGSWTRPETREGGGERE